MFYKKMLTMYSKSSNQALEIVNCEVAVVKN